MWLIAVLFVVPALSMRRTDHCEEQLAAAKEEIEFLKMKLSLHGIAADWAPHSENADVENLACCCKSSRCDVNELGSDGSRAQEVQVQGLQCCKNTEESMCEDNDLWHRSEKADACKNEKEEELQAFAKAVGPNAWQKTDMIEEQKATAKGQCEKDIVGFYNGVEAWAQANQTFHGHYIRTVHAKQFGEEVCHQLFVQGMPFGVGSPASNLFKIPQPTKLLWTGVAPEIRDKWKNLQDPKAAAGELSKETPFGKILEKEAGGALKACDFGALMPFWEAASSTLLHVHDAKPVLLLINKTKQQIQNTTFWRAEVPSLAKYPPKNSMTLVTFNMPCIELYQLLEERITEIVGSNVASLNRWKKRSGGILCQKHPSHGSRQLELAAVPYPPLFLTKTDLEQQGFTNRTLQELGFPAKFFKARGWRVQAGDLEDLFFGIRELKEGGFTAAELKEAGWQAYTLKQFGFNARELKEGGFNVMELKEVSFSARELKQGGFNARELKEVGFDAWELKDALFPALELKEAGFNAMELKEAGVTATELKKELQFGIYFRNPRELGFNARELSEFGFKAWELKSFGFNARELKEAVFSLKEFGRGDFSARELKDAGFTARELKKQVFVSMTARDLQTIGFNATELKDAGFNATQLMRLF